MDHTRSPSPSQSTRRSVPGRNAGPYPCHSYSLSQSSIHSAFPLASIHDHSLYLTDTDAGTFPPALIPPPPILMPPTYDPEWASAPVAALVTPSTASTVVGRDSPASFALSQASRPSGEQRPSSDSKQDLDEWITPGPTEAGRSNGQGAARGCHTESWREHRSSSQVTEFLSELWGAPLERNGSTWKPARGSEQRIMRPSADLTESGDV